MTKKKLSTPTDFEELTSLTALIEPEQQENTKKKTPKKKQESQKPNTKAKQQTQNQAKKKTTTKQPRKQKRYTNATAGETSSKVMTSIIISEEIRDWLRLKSITSKQSMSQQIEELVKKEMKKTKSI